jgi:putative hemolysin
MKYLRLFTLTSLLVFVACASTSVKMMLHENGDNKVLTRDTDKKRAEETALNAATQYCKSKGKEAIFADEMPQNTVRSISNAPVLLGGQGTGTGVSTPAGIRNGTVETSMSSDRYYESSVAFRCR